MKYLILYYGFINVLSFMLYALDKHKAKKHQYRISEKTLLFSSFAGGAIGALLAMFVFHHKTKHWYFMLLVPLSLIVHILLIYYIIKVSTL